MDQRALRYEQLADELGGMIAERILRPGNVTAAGRERPGVALRS